MRCVVLMAPIMQQRAPLMGRLHGESAEEKKDCCRARPLGPKTNPRKKKEKKKEIGFRDRRETSLSGVFSVLMALCSLPRHVEVSGWIAAMQEFMSVIFSGAIQARPGPIKGSQ